MDQTDKWHIAYEQSALGLPNFLPALLERNEVTDVELRTLTRGPSLQGRVTDEKVLHLAAEARARSQTSDITFWEALMVSSMKEDPLVRAVILKEALYDRTAEEGPQEHFVSTPEFVSTLMVSGFHESNERGITAITSHVRTPTGERHIPLLDFRVSPSSANTRLITEMLTILGTRGYVIDSGRSYHFYGADTLTANRYWAFLGRSQLMAPFVDERWIAHQLISSKAALRVSTNTERHVAPPRLVAWSTGLPPYRQ